MNIVQGPVNSLTLGARTFTNLSNLVSLIGNSGGSATTNKGTYREAGAAAGYAIPEGKQLRIIGVRMCTFAITAGSATQPVIQTDNDTGVAGNTAATNPVYIPSANLGSMIGAANGYESIDLDWVIPSGKFVSYIGSSAFAGALFCYGILENAPVVEE